MTGSRTPVDRLRASIAGELRSLLGAPPPSAVVDSSAGPDGDRLFGPDSMVWRVHGCRAGLIGGLRALLLQTLHPLAMAGVADHSNYRHDPWGRLQRTSAFIAVTTYGRADAAEAAIAAVRRAHERINGIAPNGLPYRANDPALLHWVHVTETDSLLAAFQRYSGRPLDPPQCDQYVAEMAEVAERLGVVGPPHSVADVAAYYRSVRPELRAGRQTFEAARFLLAPPLPLRLRPAYGVVATAAVGLLPNWARRELGLLVPPLVDPLLAQPAARLLLAALNWAAGPSPAALRAGVGDRQGLGMAPAAGA